VTPIIIENLFLQTGAKKKMLYIIFYIL